MIRGILRVVPHDSLVAGAFYLGERYNGESYLMQAIADNADTLPTHGLLFEPGTNEPLSVVAFEPATYVLMPDVSVRVDPPSLSGTAFTSSIRAGKMVVADAIPYAIATMSFRGYWVIDLSNGMVVQNQFRPAAWAAFDRWQLVVDENGEEVPIASFGADPAAD